MKLNICYSILLGIIIGTIWFYKIENRMPGNSFYNRCWIRTQPKLIVHNKVYILSTFLIYRASKCNDLISIVLLSTWLGLHLSQDIAERYYESNLS